MYKEKINAKWLEQGYIARLKELQNREAIQILSTDHEPVVIITQDEYHVLLASRRMLIPDETEAVPVSSREEFLARGKASRMENDRILAQEKWSNP